MSATAAPYGIQPISDQSGTPRTLRVPNGIASGLASNIFKYTPVFIDTATGKLKPVAATTDKIFGVFAGVEYTPSGGRPTVSPYWASGQTYDANLDMFAYVWPAWNPNQRWMIQADGSVAQTAFGEGFNFSAFTAGNTSTGLSAVSAAATPVGAGVQGQMALIEFAPLSNNAIGDAYTDLIVGIAYPQIVSAFQTAIG